MNYVISTCISNRRLANLGVFIPFVHKTQLLATEVTLFTSNNKEVLEEFLAETTSLCLVSEVNSLDSVPHMKGVLEDYSLYIKYATKKHSKEGGTSLAANTIFQFYADNSEPKVWIRPNREIKKEVEQFEEVWQDCLSKLKLDKCYFALPLPITSKASFSKDRVIQSIKEYTGIDNTYVVPINTSSNPHSSLMNGWSLPFKCSNSEFVSFKDVREELVLAYSPCLSRCPRFMGYYGGKCELGSLTCAHSRLQVEEPELLEGMY